MNISAGTLARTIILALALTNQLLTATGHSMIDVSNDDVNTLVSTAFTIGAAAVAWWKNNSFTKAAIEVDNLKDSLKGGK